MPIPDEANKRHGLVVTEVDVPTHTNTHMYKRSTDACERNNRTLRRERERGKASEMDSERGEFTDVTSAGAISPVNSRNH